MGMAGQVIKNRTHENNIYPCALVVVQQASFKRKIPFLPVVSGKFQQASCQKDEYIQVFDS